MNAPAARPMPSVEEVCMDALCMQALQVLVETCCDGDADQQRRALALFLRRVAEIEPPKRRPRLLLGPSEPETAEQAQAWATKAAEAKRDLTPGEELPEEDSKAELQAARKSAPKVEKIPDDKLLDMLVKDGGILKFYRQGVRSFNLPQRYKGHALPTYMETWKAALRRNGISVNEPAMQVVAGKMVLSLSFGDMPGIASPQGVGG